MDLGRVSLARGEFSFAETHLRPLVENDDPSIKQEAHRLLGRLLSGQEKLGEAAGHLNKALEIPASPLDEARVLFELAERSSDLEVRLVKALAERSSDLRGHLQESVRWTRLSLERGDPRGLVAAEQRKLTLASLVLREAVRRP